MIGDVQYYSVLYSENAANVTHFTAELNAIHSGSESKITDGWISSMPHYTEKPQSFNAAPILGGTLHSVRFCLIQQKFSHVALCTVTTWAVPQDGKPDPIIQLAVSDF